MTSRASIRSRLASQRESRERLAWPPLSTGRGGGDDGDINGLQKTLHQSPSGYRSAVRTDVASDSSASRVFTPETIQGQGHLIREHQVQTRMDTLEDWRRSFRLRSSQAAAATDRRGEFENNAARTFDTTPESQRQAENDDQNSDGNGSIFESNRFRSLRSKKQKDLDLLSERYRQQREDFRRTLEDRAENLRITIAPKAKFTRWEAAPTGGGSQGGRTFHDFSTPTTAGDPSESGNERRRNWTSWRREKESSEDGGDQCRIDSWQTEDGEEEGKETEKEEEEEEKEKEEKEEKEEEEEEEEEAVERDANRTRTLETHFHCNQNESSSIDLEQTPSPSPSTTTTTTTTNNNNYNDDDDDDEYYENDDGRDNHDWSSSIEEEEEGRTKNGDRSIDGKSRQHYNNNNNYNQYKNGDDDNNNNHHRYNDDDDSNSYQYNDGDSFSRDSSIRKSRQQQQQQQQQAGLKGTFQGLFARIGRKIGRNDTSKLTKDEKILAIMVQKREEELREEREREEAHARWEAEKLELQRNSSARRSIDPGLFRRRNSLGGSVSGSKREASKPRNIEKQAERKKLNELQEAEQRQQLQMKLESDFQRANSLRSSISQQNLLKAKLKNLQLEQKQQHISQQKRKSMENLSQLKKQLETKHIVAEQKLENMRKEQRKSREDLRCKQEQSKLKLQQLNEELAQYQAELQEFNDKQLQHADFMMRRFLMEKIEMARKERLEKERALLENKRRIQEEELKKSLEKEEILKAKERKREQLIREKLEFQAKARAAARASQLLREEIRNSDDLSLTAKKLAALPDRFFASKRSSDTDSMTTSSTTSPAHQNRTTKM